MFAQTAVIAVACLVGLALLQHNPVVIPVAMSPAQNDSLGGMYAGSCGTGEIVTGINSTGHVTCGALPEPVCGNKTMTVTGGGYVRCVGP